MAHHKRGWILPVFFVKLVVSKAFRVPCW